VPVLRVISTLGTPFGYSAVEAFYAKHWREELDTVLGGGMKDPKTRLQELALSKGSVVPLYSVMERSGPDHRPSFTIAVSIDGMGTATGVGPSKKEAERVAAQNLLEQVKA